jgi:site-specific DNA-methyltransferase (adenine-specific)
VNSSSNMPSEIVPSPELLPAINEFTSTVAKIIETGTVPEIIECRQRSEALRQVARAARTGLEIQNAFAEQRLRLERRLGEMLIDSLSRGRPRNVTTEDNIRLDDLGISRNLSARSQRIAVITTDRFDAYFREARDAGWEVTATGLTGLLPWSHTEIYSFNKQRDGWAANGHRTADHDARYYAARVHKGYLSETPPGEPRETFDCPVSRPWLICGDSLEAMEQIADQSIDLILSDPPFGLRTDHVWNKPLDLRRLWEQYRRVIRPHRPIILFAAQPFATDLIASARDLFRFDMIWLKTRCANFVKANAQPLRNHELILVFSEGVLDAASHTKRKMPYYGNQIAVEDRYPRTVIDDHMIEFSKEPRLHPMQKPVSLLRYLISMFSQPGETILDTFMGSGSTGVAAAETNRNFVGIEKAQVYFESAAERLGVTSY